MEVDRFMNLESLWSFPFLFQKDKNICPRCKSLSFQHGFIPDERYYCTNCGLWCKEYGIEYTKEISESNKA